MSYVPIPDLKDIRTFEDDPILSRKAYKYGIINVYAPDAPAEEWPDRAWLLTSEYDGAGEMPGMRVEIKASVVSECLQRPYCINQQHLFV